MEHEMVRQEQRMIQNMLATRKHADNLIASLRLHIVDKLDICKGAMIQLTRGWVEVVEVDPIDGTLKVVKESSPTGGQPSPEEAYPEDIKDVQDEDRPGDD